MVPMRPLRSTGAALGAAGVLLGVALIVSACSSGTSPGALGYSYGGGAGAASPSAATGGSSGGSSGGGQAATKVVDFAFNPATLTVAAGTTVTWTNTGSVSHTVTADDGSFDSGTLPSGGTFQHRFATPGTYAYHCNIHHSMTAKVIVTP